MRKAILLLIVNLCFAAIASAQQLEKVTPEKIARAKKMIDSLLKLRRALGPSARVNTWGEKIEVFAEYSTNGGKTWKSRQLYTTAESQLSNFFRWQKLTNVSKARIDSIRKKLPNYQGLLLRSNILTAIKLSPKSPPYRPDTHTKVLGRTYSGYILPDGSQATVYALGINPGNVKNYRYRVIVNDSAEVVHWSPVPLEQKYDVTQPYGILGNFIYPGKRAVIEVQNINDFNDRAGVVFDWRVNHNPVILQFEGQAYHNTFSLNDTRRGYSRMIDTTTGLPTDLKFPAQSINRLTFDFQDHEGVPYGLVIISGSGITSMSRTVITENHFELTAPEFNEPGQHEIIISSVAALGSKSKPLHIPFFVKPPIPGYNGQTPTTYSPGDPEQETAMDKVGTYALGILAITGVGVALYYFYNRRKLQKAEREKAMAALQLKSVRSQLNPHYMFNALTSIQNLMNQRDTEGANHYLTKFAGLTRQVLKASDQEMISLNDELQLITDYLEMEQLRFGFKFSIEVDPKLSKPNTEIPTMLVQPFVENAAKHGVSALRGDGEIKVSFVKNIRDLTITIADNGPGFTGVNSTDGGHGMNLSKDKIRLLNQLYKDQPITLHINRNEPGAKITITLSNWF